LKELNGAKLIFKSIPDPSAGTFIYRLKNKPQRVMLLLWGRIC